MTDRREARRLRAEQERLERDRFLRQRKFRSRALFVAGVIVALTIGILAATRTSGERAGRVWSAEHGHWHEK
jgi:hypothetical protein